MKQAICTLTILATISLNAQKASSPPSTPPGVFAPPPTAPSQLSPANPALAPAPTVPGVPGFTAQTPIVGFTNSAGTNVLGVTAISNEFGTNIVFGTNAVGIQLASTLAVLENNVQQALSLIAAFNAGTGVVAESALPATSGTPGNFSQNLAGNAAVNLSQNLGANVATPTGTLSATPPPSALEIGTNTAGLPALATPPTGVTNALGLSTAFGASVTNALTSAGASPNSAALVVLENDLQRILSEIALVNSGGLATPANQPAAATPGTSLTPTGR